MILSGIFFWTAFATLIWLVPASVLQLRGSRSIRSLKDLPPYSGTPCPRVSVIAPARNEERNIEQAVRSLLEQDYGDFELLVVEDRSTDGTPRILERLARERPALRVKTVRELPSGWLGKNHALHAGAREASGEYLLFADADVHMRPSALSRAMRLITSENLDHVTVMPELRLPGFLLGLFGGAFTLFFSFYAEPWKARDPRSPKHIGVGAFNLVRAAVYRRAGGHEAIRMRPDDDMKLGKILKEHGARQEVLYGREMLEVEWYSSFRELVEGLMKNSFAALEYRLTWVIGVTAAMLVIDVWPFLAVWAAPGAARWLNAAIVALIFLLYLNNSALNGTLRRYVFGFPLAALISIYIIWRATVLTLLSGGIRWRGTYYSLKELKANKR